MAAVRTDLDNVFGSRNVDLWADLNNDNSPTEIAARVTWALNLATEFVKAKFRSSAYDWDDVVDDAIVEHIVAVKAGLFLYANRAVSDEEEKANPMRRHEKMLDDWFKDLSANKVSLSASRKGRPWPAIIDDDGYDISTNYPNTTT